MTTIHHFYRCTYMWVTIIHALHSFEFHIFGWRFQFSSPLMRTVWIDNYYLSFIIFITVILIIRHRDCYVIVPIMGPYYLNMTSGNHLLVQ